jgi:hypothetical protein
VGFVAVYILGCYRDDDGRSATTSMNSCHNSDRGRNDGGPCQHHNFFGQCTDNSNTEVRAGIVRMYVASDQVKSIDEFTSSNNGMLRDIGAMAIETRQ